MGKAHASAGDEAPVTAATAVAAIEVAVQAGTGADAERLGALHPSTGAECGARFFLITKTADSVQSRGLDCIHLIEKYPGKDYMK